MPKIRNKPQFDRAPNVKCVLNLYPSRINVIITDMKVFDRNDQRSKCNDQRKTIKSPKRKRTRKRSISRTGRPFHGSYLEIFRRANFFAPGGGRRRGGEGKNADSAGIHSRSRILLIHRAARASQHPSAVSRFNYFGASRRFCC